VIEVTMKFASQEELLAFFTKAPAPVAAPVAEEAPKAPKASRAAKAEKPAATPPAPPEPIEQTSQSAAPEPATESPSDNKVVSLEEVRALLGNLSQGGKKAEVMALISEFGATRLTDIPVEKYPSLCAKALAL